MNLSFLSNSLLHLLSQHKLPKRARPNVVFAPAQKGIRHAAGGINSKLNAHVNAAAPLRP
jgi:hypothetical protein